MSDENLNEDQDVDVVDVIEEDGLTIEVVDDRVDGRDPVPLEELDEQEPALTDDEIRKLGQRAQKRIGQLTFEAKEVRRQLEAANRERDQAIEAARRAIHASRQNDETVVTYQQALVQGQTELAKREIEKAEQAVAEASESGDSAAYAKAQTALTQAIIRARDIEEASRNLQSRRNQSAQSTEPTDGMTSQASPETLAWAKKNESWFHKDEAMTSLAYGVHEHIIRNGLAAPNTPEYFKMIDDEVRRRFPERFNDQSGDVIVDTQPAAAPAASPQHSTPVAPTGRTSGSSKQKGRVRLSQSEVALAKKLGITPQQYAEEKLKMESA